MTTRKPLGSANDSNPNGQNTHTHTLIIDVPMLVFAVAAIDFFFALLHDEYNKVSMWQFMGEKLWISSIDRTMTKKQAKWI